MKISRTRPPRAIQLLAARRLFFLSATSPLCGPRTRVRRALHSLCWEKQDLQVGEFVAVVALMQRYSLGALPLYPRVERDSKR